ncbi:NIPSNAP family protein [Streptomyces sasae]|uniref:NIPSNAP family protein n=1 Tax=Streptomyces sasae TaxID=1266772 RepID=UPI003743E479
MVWPSTGSPHTASGRCPRARPPQLYALVSYQDADDVQERLEAYLSSPEFRADMEGFDISRIVGVDESLLTPTADSPLR